MKMKRERERMGSKVIVNGMGRDGMELKEQNKEVE